MLAEVGIGVCVGVVALVWVFGALYNASRARDGLAHAPPDRPEFQSGATERYGWVAVAVVCVILAMVSRRYLEGLAVAALWVRAIGLAVLAISTVFTVWARLSIGGMWTAVPRLQGDHLLRTHGPYAVTRHPIYTGGLGMLAGITLLAGLGQWLVLLPACVIVLEVKIRIEEHLLLAAFPDEYSQYRQHVPQLVPCLHAPVHRAHKGPALPRLSSRSPNRQERTP